MVNYRYLGYGITDENGIATLDHDANGDPITHSYTGTGAGELDIIASLDDNTHISDSSIQSEIYEVIDALFYDVATSFDSTKWNNYGCTTSYSDNGTTLSYGTDYRYQPKYDIDDGLYLEFDINIPSTVTVDPQLYIKGLTPYFSQEWFPRDVWHHIKITCQNGRYDLYSDGEWKIGGAYNTQNKIFQFRVTNSELTFKNFCIYPI